MDEVARITAFTCDIGKDERCYVNVFIEDELLDGSRFYFGDTDEVMAFLETNLD
jgi:hypothetical protein